MNAAMDCTRAAGLLLEGASSDALSGHVATCPECAQLARDIAAFGELVRAARVDLEARVPAPRVSDRPERALRVLSGGRVGTGPGASRARRVQRAVPIALAAAAALVAVTTATVLLRDDAAPRRPRSTVVLRETGERPTTPDRPVAREQAPAIALAPAPSPTVRPIAPPARERRLEPRAPRVSAPPPDERRPYTGPAPEDLAQRTLRGRLPLLQHCYERALRRDLRLGDATAELTVDIGTDGSVDSVAVSGDANGVLRQCVEQTLRRTQFPSSEDGLRVTVPLRFEVIREQMGTNVTRP